MPYNLIGVFYQKAGLSNETCQDISIYKCFLNILYLFYWVYKQVTAVFFPDYENMYSLYSLLFEYS